MAWQSLPSVTLNKDGAYVPLPLVGAGGRVPLQIPAFADGEAGRFEVGIYDLPQGGPPGLVAPVQDALIARYTRSLVFEVPPSIAAPHVGIRLLNHAELETKTFSIAIQWQPPYGSGTGDGGGTPVPSGFIAAVPWSEIKQAAIAEISQGYATIESVTTQLAEIQNAIDALASQNSVNAATQQALAAIATRVATLESTDPAQAQAIASINARLEDLGHSAANYETAFTNASLSINNTLAVIHGLISTPSSVAVYPPNGEAIHPDNIIYVNENSVAIDLTSFVPLIGTWTVSVVI